MDMVTITAPQPLAPSTVHAQRMQLWDAGFRPVAIYNHDHPGPSAGKRPLGNGWTDAARQDPPFCVTAAPVSHALNTGILCDGLRAIDVDIDDADTAHRVRSLALDMFGEAPMRYRSNSPRVLLLYRAASGQPEKRVLAGRDGRKVEILGRGQQFVAFGIHTSGALLQWMPEAPGEVTVDSLPAITEAQITSFLERAAPLIGAEPPRQERPTDRAASGRGLGADTLQVLTALQAIPNDGPSDWEAWNRIGMAVWAATGNSEAGRAAWHAWSSQHSAYDQAATDERWFHYADSPPTQIGAGTLFYLARRGTGGGVADEPESVPGWHPDDPGYLAAPPAQAGAADDPWPDPLDFLADAEATGAPELRRAHVPDAIADFVFDGAERMGVDPSAMALAGLVALSSVISDDWAIQPKQHDDTWTENPRLWGAIVGDPSILKTPVLKATTRPIDAMEADARERYASAVQRYKAALKEWKDGGSDPAAEPKHPRLERYMVEGTTIEALSEALRDDFEARQTAPARKVLVRQDEMSEWVASFDRYRSGGRGGGDRGAYLRLFNGGRYTIDRVNRGSFAVPNWSACVLGGIQPGPIQQIARDAADDGLLQRFCYCVPAQQGRGQDRRPDAGAAKRFEALFPALAALHPSQAFTGTPRPVVLHAAAHAHRLAILDLAEAVTSMPDTSGRLRAALGKWPGLFARLALIFHLIDVADVRMSQMSQGGAARAVTTAPPALEVVPETTARRVASYMRDILLPHLLRAEAVMFASEQTGHARWIAGYILSKGEDRITSRDIVRAYGALRAPEQRRELLSVMESLETVGWVIAEERDPPGKSPTSWRVNPKIHSTFASRAQREREARADAKRRIAETVQRLRNGGVG